MEKYKSKFKESNVLKLEQEIINYLVDSKDGLVSINGIKSFGFTISNILSEFLNQEDKSFAIKNLVSSIERSGNNTKTQYDGTKLK